MQSVSSRIWTCIAVSISYDDNHYTMPLFNGISNPDELFNIKSIFVEEQ